MRQSHSRKGDAPYRFLFHFNGYSKRPADNEIDGIPSHGNSRLLDKLVAENNGRSDYVKPKEPIEGKVGSLYAKIKNPVMTGSPLPNWFSNER